MDVGKSYVQYVMVLGEKTVRPVALAGAIGISSVANAVGQEKHNEHTRDFLKYGSHGEITKKGKTYGKSKSS